MYSIPVFQRNAHILKERIEENDQIAFETFTEMYNK